VNATLSPEAVACLATLTPRACPHWSADGTDAGRCALRLYDGSASPGTRRRCPMHVPDSTARGPSFVVPDDYHPSQYRAGGCGCKE
jgi:hypothetical protein